MNLAFFLVFQTKISLVLLTQGTDLLGDYPFSIKLGYNEAITFMDAGKVSIFKVNNLGTTSDPMIPSTLSPTPSECITFEEKGAIYLNGYYYLSCLENSGTEPKKFKIKIYDNDFLKIAEVPDPNDLDPSPFSLDSGSSIRFFIIQSSDDLIGVAWFYENKLKIIQIKEKEKISSVEYSEIKFARDTDCIYMNKYQRIVCAFGLEKNGQYGQFICGLNMFYIKLDDENNGEYKIISTSNLKLFDSCMTHHSRKLRVISDPNEGSDSFFYYFVGTDRNAYVSKVIMKNDRDFIFNEPKQVLKGCLQSQNSFDLAEDLFLGYNVFSCVEYQFRTKIKIQLFKIDVYLIEMIEITMHIIQCFSSQLVIIYLLLILI